VSRASVKAYQHLARELEKLGQKNPCPNPGSPWRESPPDHFPALWASSWGEDEFGLWCGISVDDIELRLRWIPAGQVLMGSPETEPERFDWEIRYQVEIPGGYWMAETACTQRFWQAVTGERAGEFKGPERPVESVSWEQVTTVFLQSLNNKVPSLEARLPTEVEWEYACRAGSTSPFWWGDVLSVELANYNGSFPYNKGPEGIDRDSTLEVWEFFPNPWGLYQMHGNVWEWCDDDWCENPLEPDNGETEAGRRRVVRGGSWNDVGRNLRSAMRVHYSADSLTTATTILASAWSQVLFRAKRRNRGRPYAKWPSRSRPTMRKAIGAIYRK